ncbi:MAG: OB-fold domain-containing protein [Thermodesulfobacteriota bacterium]
MNPSVPIREDLFREGLDGWKLIGNKCQSCGKIYFPKAKTICLNCLSPDLIEISLNRRGKLYSFTIASVPSEHFHAPYTVGYIILNEKVRVFSQIEESNNKPLKINMEMELVIGDLWKEDEKHIIGYKFKPV